jgi:outer membrane beta-barrel protein
MTRAIRRLTAATVLALLAGAHPARAADPEAEAPVADAADAGAPAAPVRHEMNEPWVLRDRMVRLNQADVNVVRTGPGESFAVARTVGRDAKFLVLAKKGDWYNVRLSESETAWVHESLCEEYADLSGLEFRPNPRLFSRIGSFTVTAYGGGYSFDRKSNTFTAGGRLGYYVFDFVQVEGGVGWTHVDRPAEVVESLFDLTLEAEQFHMLFYEMNANVELLPGRQLVPYATAGVGSTIMQGETEGTFNYGGGINFFVKKSTAVRWEFRTYHFQSGSDNARRDNSNYTFTVGTTFLL